MWFSANTTHCTCSKQHCVMSQVACKTLLGLHTMLCVTCFCMLTKQHRPCMHSQARCILCQVGTCMQSCIGHARPTMFLQVLWCIKLLAKCLTMVSCTQMQCAQTHSSRAHCVGILPSEWSSQGGPPCPIHP